MVLLVLDYRVFRQPYVSKRLCFGQHQFSDFVSLRVCFQFALNIT